MRILLAAVVALGLAASASGQIPLRVEITDGEIRTGMTAAVSAPYLTGVPFAFVPARPLKPGVTPTVAEFRFRAWLEGGGVRVLVFAVRNPDTDDDGQSPIASVSLSPGQSVEVITEKYGARPIRISAPTARALDLMTPYRLQTIRGYKGDTPDDPGMRPWQPAPRGSSIHRQR